MIKNWTQITIDHDVSKKLVEALGLVPKSMGIEGLFKRILGVQYDC